MRSPIARNADQAAGVAHGKMMSLKIERVAASRHFAVHDVCCTAVRDGWSQVEQADSYEVVFVRAGCFQRRVDGVLTLVDPTVVYVRVPGEQQEISHPGDGGDVCTAIDVSAAAMSLIWGDTLTTLPSRIHSTPEIDLAHRELMRACRLGIDSSEVDERIWMLISQTFTQAAPGLLTSRRPASAEAHKSLVEAARQTLNVRPRMTLAEISHELAVSPHHLSRVFRDQTGQTVSGYRNRLRVRTALERIGAGETSLVRLAFDLGFADHAHLTRVIGAETGSSPSRLRALL